MRIDGGRREILGKALRKKNGKKKKGKRNERDRPPQIAGRMCAKPSGAKGVLGQNCTPPKRGTNKQGVIGIRGNTEEKNSHKTNPDETEEDTLTFHYHRQIRRKEIHDGPRKPKHLGV